MYNANLLSSGFPVKLRMTLRPFDKLKTTQAHGYARDPETIRHAQCFTRDCHALLAMTDSTKLFPCHN